MAKRLIAARPIQYMGRTYSRGDTLPAHDPKMTDAWLKHGSAKWEEDAAKGAPAIQQQTEQSAIDPITAQALQVLDGMGVKITDDAGEFCGEEELINRITSAIVGEPPEGQVALVAAHLDAEGLATMKTEALEKLAADLGVDISGAKNNAERAALIAKVEVLIPETAPAE